MKNKQENASGYPRTQIIENFFLFGGATGGVLLALAMIIESIFSSSTFELFYLLTGTLIIILCAGIGFILGLLPALITALILCRNKVYFDSFAKAIIIFTIGFFSTSIFAMLPIYYDDSINKGIFLLLLSSIGGASAVATGWFALPK